MLRENSPNPQLMAKEPGVSATSHINAITVQHSKLYMNQIDNARLFATKKELHSNLPNRVLFSYHLIKRSQSFDYFTMEATAPAPTVRPPSRIAKRVPSSIAIGEISSTVTSTLSPGITKSVPSGKLMMPVTSVVRK
jgi:hypothetical protein